MGALFSFLASIVTTSLANLFGSWKSVVLVSLVAFLGIGLYNLVVDIIQEVFDFASASMSAVNMGDGPPTSAMEFAGLAGYLATQLRLPECLSWVMSITLLKWLLAKIPFVKW